MEKFYEIIEKKIKESGYPGFISGEEIYNDVCDQIDEQENGFYILLSKFSDQILIEYQILIQDEDFDLKKITIKTPDGEYQTEL